MNVNAGFPTPQSDAQFRQIPAHETQVVVVDLRLENSADEFENTRLTNFLSDDLSAEKFDFDNIMSRQPSADPAGLPVTDALTSDAAGVRAASAEIPAPLRGANQVVTASPVESAIRNILDADPQEAPEPEAADTGSTSTGSSSASNQAIEMYTAVQDVMTRMAA